MARRVEIGYTTDGERAAHVPLHVLESVCHGTSEAKRMFKFLGKIFDNNEKAIRTYQPRVAAN